MIKNTSDEQRHESQVRNIHSLFLLISELKHRFPPASRSLLACARIVLPQCIRFLIILSLIIIPSICFTGTIEIEWDPPSSGEVTGYKIYYGTASGSYQSIVDVGPVTSYSLTDLDDCKNYFWAIKAYNSIGQESANFSNEVSGMARPRIETVTPDSGEQGQSLDVHISGANFASAFALEPANPGIKVTSVSSLSCNEISVSIQIDPQSRGIKPALIGPNDLTVVNSDKVFGMQEDAFEITLNKSRIDIDMSGRIDGLDLNKLALLFGINESNRLYNPDCDFDGNGWIDGDDLAYLATSFGMSF